MIRLFILTYLGFLSFAVLGQANSQSESIGALPDNGNQIDNLFLEPDFIPVKKGTVWAWYTISNDSISEDYCFTDFIHPTNGYQGDFVLKNDSLWGVMSGMGHERTGFIYDSIIMVNEHLFTRTGKQWTYHQSNDISDTLIELELDSVYAAAGIVYLYANGKIGAILQSSVLVHPKYDAIHTFGCGVDYDGQSNYLMTLNGTEFNLIGSSGEELLPRNVWDLRCTEDYMFEFRRDQHPEYYSPFTEKLINPNGRDIIFYGYEGYKIYSNDKKTSEFYKNDGTILSKTYDDYFVLSNDFKVVRKNGKVGLIKNENDLRCQLKYDQITEMYSWGRGENQINYFKFFQGDSCGMMDEFGVEKINAKYANILLTDDEDRFVVIDKEICGVVDRNGRVVIPMKYDYISFDAGSQLFVVQNKNRLGLFRRDGTELIPIVYERHKSHQNYNAGNATHAIHVLAQGKELYFANSEGLIESKPAVHYDYTGSVLKVYDQSEITVYALNTKGLVEEKLSYPLYKPTLIKDNYFDNWVGLNGWIKALVEENQEEGYYGLRNYAKRGFCVPPKYRTIRPTSFNSFLGEVAFETDEIKWLGDLPMKVIRSYDEVKVGSGAIENYPLFNTETVIHYSGTDSRRLNFELDRAQEFSNRQDPIFSESELQELIHFGDFARGRDHVRRFIKGGRAEICSIDSSDISLYDYYAYWNLLDAVRISPELMKSVLNPRFGVRFVDSKEVIVNTFGSNIYRTTLDFEVPVNYEKFEFITPALFFEKFRGEKSGKLRKFYLQEDGREAPYIDDVISAEAAPGYIGNLILTDVSVSKMAKIHIDYPNYLFHQDSIDLSYEAGRVTRRIDSNFVRLISPEGAVLADSCVLIRYLNEERFAVLRSEGWELIDKNGGSLSDLRFIAVDDFENDRAEFSFADGSAILLNSNGEEVMPLPEPRIFLDENHYYFASAPSLITNRANGLQDGPRIGEKYQSNGFFVSKEDGKTRVRRLGSVVNTELKGTPSLKSFGNSLYYEEGKHFYSMDASLKITKHKKIDKFRIVSNEIGWLEGKKDVLIDSDWNAIHTIGKTERFELRDGNLVILEGDSVKINFGSFKENEPDSIIEQLPAVKVVSENGKYGVQQGNEILLPMRYSWLSKINDQEFMTKIDSEKHLYNSSLDRIGNRPFDSFIQTIGGNFVFFYHDQTYVVSMDRTQQRIIN